MYITKLNWLLLIWRIHCRVTGSLLKILSLHGSINRAREPAYMLPIIRTIVFNRL